MKKDLEKVKETSARYEINHAVLNGLKKIERAIKRGLNKRSRLYRDVIIKHQEAWEKLANL